MDKLSRLVGQYAGKNLPWVPVVVTSVAGWVDEQPNVVGCLMGTMPLWVHVTAGFKPNIGDKLFTRKLTNRDNSPWVALPKLVPALRQVQGMLVPAFDNTWYKHSLGYGSYARHPDDPYFSVVLGRRIDNSWVIRGPHPHTAARFFTQSGGLLRDRMKVYLGAEAPAGPVFIPNTWQISWAVVDGPDEPAPVTNAYLTPDDGLTWFDLTYPENLMDIKGVFNFTIWLHHGGRKLANLVNVGGNFFNPGSGFLDIPITGRHWKLLDFAQYQSFNGGLSFRDWGFLAGPDGITVFQYTRNGGVGTTRVLEATHGPYAYPEATDCPWECWGIIVENSASHDNGYLLLLPGKNIDGSPVNIYYAPIAGLGTGTASWSVAQDFHSGIPLDPSIFDDHNRSDLTVHQDPPLWGLGAGALWPNFAFEADHTSPFTSDLASILDIDDPLLIPEGAVARAPMPRFRTQNITVFEQFRNVTTDALAFQFVNLAVVGPAPGAGATYDGDGVGLEGEPVYGPRLYGVAADPITGDPILIDDSGTIREDTAQSIEEYTPWGNYVRPATGQTWQNVEVG